MKEFIGIDVSKETLDCSWLRNLDTGKIKSHVHNNTVSGYQALVIWLLKVTQAAPEAILVTLEATGVYHEILVEHLDAAGFKVLLANPGKAKDFAKSQNQRNKTDRIDSVMLARYGQVAWRYQPLWQPEPLETRQLSAMIRRLAALEKDLQRELNRLEAAEFSGVSPRVIQSIETMVGTLKGEIEQLKKTIDDLIDARPSMNKDRQLLQSIQGVGEVVSREIVSLFHSKRFDSGRQAAAFLGLIPLQHESGKLKGRVTLSKQGPGRLRAKLYMAAVVACQHNPRIRAHYSRLLARGKTKMQAIGAAMRKLVEICFAVIKHQCEFQCQKG